MMVKFLVFLITIGVLQSGASFAYYHSYSAAVTTDYFTTSGADISDGTAAVFDNNALTKLSASDDSRIQSDGSWPTNGAYDESRYIEFIFSPNLPESTAVTSVTVTHEFRRGGTLTAAKLEVWDGQNFVNESLQLPSSSNTDFSETKDITSYLNVPSKLNGLKIRFLAYRSTEASIKTSHDLIKITVVRDTVGTSTPTPTPTPTATLTPGPTPATPTPSATPTPKTSAKPSTSPSPTGVEAGIVTPRPVQSVAFSPSVRPPPIPSLEIKKPAIPIIPEIKKPNLVPSALAAVGSDDAQQQLASINQTKSRYFALLALGIAFLIVYFRRWRKL